MNILITSGSIVETIDNVYYIGQKSDASIAAIIGEEFSKDHNVDKIFFLYGEKSRFPWESSSSNDQKFFLDEWLDKVGLFPVLNMNHFTSTLEKLLSENHIDVVIHLMSVPNYGKTVVHLLKHEKDAKDFVKKIAENFGLQVEVSTNEEGNALAPTPSTFGKMKAGYQRVFLEQQPQEKVLSFIQGLSPNATVISSKFEFDVEEDDLVSLGKQSLAKNNTDFVIASDIESYKKGDEDGYYIIGKDGSSTKRLDSEDLAARLLDIFLP